jgi:hypothetical protein
MIQVHWLSEHPPVSDWIHRETNVFTCIWQSRIYDSRDSSWKSAPSPSYVTQSLMYKASNWQKNSEISIPLIVLSKKSWRSRVFSTVLIVSVLVPSTNLERCVTLSRKYCCSMMCPKKNTNNYICKVQSIPKQSFNPPFSESSKIKFTFTVSLCEFYFDHTITIPCFFGGTNRVNFFARSRVTWTVLRSVLKWKIEKTVFSHLKECDFG